MWRNIFLCIVAVGIGILIGRLCRGSLAPDINVVTKIDTLVVRDTIREIVPVFDAEIDVPDMVVVIEDSIIVNDDSLLVLPMQQKHYKGDNYEAWVSGYRPQLDSVWVFPETKYVTTTVTETESVKRWGLGIQAGIGGTIQNGRVMVVPYIGVGISYNIVRW